MLRLVPVDQRLPPDRVVSSLAAAFTARLDSDARDLLLRALLAGRSLLLNPRGTGQSKLMGCHSIPP